MKKIIQLFIMLCFCQLTLQAQTPNLIFSNTYASNSTNSDYGTALLHTQDGGVLLGGWFGHNSGNLNPAVLNTVFQTNAGFLSKQNEAGIKVWSYSYGGEINQIAEDGNGNIYVVGSAVGTATSIHGLPIGAQGNNTLSNSNIIIAKILPDGSLAWAKYVGANGNDYGTGIAIDANNDVYISGVSDGTAALDFEPGNPAATINLGFKSFVVKMNSSGNFIWCRSVPANSPNGGHNICVDGNNVYFATRVAGNPVNVNSTGTFNVSTNGGGYDICLIKYRLDGTFVTAKVVGGSTNNDYARSVAVRNGKVVFGGSISGTNINMNAIAPAVNVSSNGGTNRDAVVALYDTLDFACNWAKTIGGTSNDDLWRVRFDPTGNITIAGHYTGSNVNFNVGSTGSFVYSSNGTSASDYFYANYLLATGECQWVYRASNASTSADEARDIDYSPEGILWATGLLASSTSGNDIFLNKHQCNLSDSITLRYRGTALTQYSNYQFAAIGCNNQTAIFDFSVINASNNTRYRFYDMDGLAVDNDSLSVNVINGIANKGFLVFAQDTVTHCEKIYTFRFSQINTISSFTLTPSTNNVCSGTAVTLNGNQSWSGIVYSWDPLGISTAPNVHSITVTPSNTTTYTATIYDGVACYYSASTTINVSSVDTSVSINGTTLSANLAGATYQWVDCNNGNVIGANNQSFTPTVSGEYALNISFNGCTATSACYYINIACLSTSSSINDSACDSYTLNGQTYTASGTYTQTLTNAAGCDSTITLNLTINTVDASVTQTGTVLSANASGAQYQWVDCNNNNDPIAGANAQSFNPTISGDYAVIVSANGCTQTSSCFGVTVVSTQIIADELAFSLMPNPTSSILRIQTQENIHHGLINIFDVNGRQVKNLTLMGNSLDIDVQELPSAIYFIKISTDLGAYSSKFVKF